MVYIQIQNSHVQQISMSLLQLKYKIPTCDSTRSLFSPEFYNKTHKPHSLFFSSVLMMIDMRSEEERVLMVVCPVTGSTVADCNKSIYTVFSSLFRTHVSCNCGWQVCSNCSSPRRYSYSLLSSMHRHRETHTHIQTGARTDSLFDSFCLLTDDSSGVEIAHIPLIATVHSGPTRSPYTA